MPRARRHLAISHASSDIEQDGQSEAATSYNAQATIPITLRPREEFARFFRDLDLVPPGLVWTPQWRPEPEAEMPSRPADSLSYALVARKP